MIFPKNMSVGQAAYEHSRSVKYSGRVNRHNAVDLIRTVEPYDCSRTGGRARSSDAVILEGVCNDTVSGDSTSYRLFVGKFGVKVTVEVKDALAYLCGQVNSAFANMGTKR